MRNCFIKSNNMLKKIILFVLIPNLIARYWGLYVYKSGKKRQKFFIVLFVMSFLIINCFIQMVFAYSFVKEIVSLEKKNYDLNRELISKLTFVLDTQGIFDDGQTCKFLLKDEMSDDLWLFKVYASSLPVNNTLVACRFAQLLGIDTSEISSVVLPVNERSRYGSIQRILTGVNNINKIAFDSLSAEQIGCIMKNQVLDWLIFNTDVDGDEFLCEKKTGKIIAIDKDESFGDEEEVPALSYNVGMDSYYFEFWAAYIKDEVKISDNNFMGVFKMIDYFQDINDKYIVNIMNDLLGNIIDASSLNSITKKVISRKNSLRKDFEAYYGALVEKKNVILKFPEIDKNNTYANKVLEKLKIKISEKTEKLNVISSVKKREQKNIRRISCSDAWYLMEDLMYESRADFICLSNQTIKELNFLREKVPSIDEQFVVDLYIEKVKELQRREDFEFFFDRYIKRVIIYPGKLISNKIVNIEYNLRSVYGKLRKEFSSYKEDVDKNSKDIIKHLNFFQYPIDDGEEEAILKKYEELIKDNPQELIYRVLYGVLIKDEDYLLSIDDKFVWKYFGLGLVYSLDKKRNSAIDECRKFLLHKGNKETTYWCYMLLGVIYEHNRNWLKFGEGFELEKAINAYQNAILVNPNSVKGHLNLGILYLIKEEPDKAVNEFREVAKLDPVYGREYFHFNKIKERSFYKDDKEYLESVRMNTLSGRHHYILGMAYMLKEDTELATRHFDKAKEFGYSNEMRQQYNH